jgi:hypothetical protein
MPRKNLLVEEHLRQQDFRARSSMPSSIPRLYDCPLPLEDESFSSWTVRASVHYSMPTKKFILMALGVDTYHHAFVDHDVCAPENLFRRLGQMTGQESVLFESMFRLTPRRLSWPSVGWLHINLRYGRQLSKFCVECLRSDKVPYFRNLWRYTAISRCDIHHVEFAEACRHCGQPVAPSRYAPSKKSNHAILGQCPYCNGCLYESTHTTVSKFFLHISNPETLASTPTRKTASLVAAPVKVLCWSKYKNSGKKIKKRANARKEKYIEQKYTLDTLLEFINNLANLNEKSR